MLDDQDDNTESPEPDKQESPHPAFVRFFFDPERPVALRAGLGVLLLLFLTFPFFTSKPKRTNSGTVPTGISENSFPTGHANLADTDVGQDSLRAVLLDSEPEDERKAERRFKRLTEEPVEEKKPLPKQVGPFAVLTTIAQHPAAIELGDNNDVWVADRTALLQFPKGDTANPVIKLSRKTFDKEFNADLPPLSSVMIDSKGVIWAGFANGQLMRYRRYEWKVLSQPYDPVRGKFFDFAEVNGELIGASVGIWRWDESFQRLIGNKAFRTRQISSFTRGVDGTLFASGKSGVWKFDETSKTWSSLWKPLKQDGSANVVRITAEGALLVGTKNGIVRLSQQGIVVERMLAGEIIGDILIDSDSHLWVGTRKNGLRYWNGQDWHKAGSAEGLTDSVSTIKLDQQNRIWLAGKNPGGLFVGPRDKVTKWMQQFAEDEVDDDEPQIFAGPCEAADALLKGVSLSGGIATRVVDGRLLVFFRGKQVCPKGVGFHRPDGLIVTIDGWNLTTFVDQKRTAIEIPEEFAADQITVAYVDSKNRIWLGTEKQGVYRYADESWVQYGQHEQLLNNPVRAFIEDTTGGFWVGTTPQFDKAQRTFHLPPLHGFNPEAGWFHLSPKEGLAHWGVYAMAILRNESLLAATTGGLSIINQRGEITNINSRDGIKPQFAYAISLDSAGNIWFAHQYFGDGVSWYTGTEVHHVDKTQGLFANRITNLVHDRKNRVWMVSSNGSVGVYPRSFFQQNKTTKPIAKRKQMSLTQKPKTAGSKTLRSTR